MPPTNPLHHTTRTVRLPETWENAPRDVQVNYYNYRTNRLMPSTDVYIGDRLVYRTNAIGCRGDDVIPGRPIVGIFGGDLVHGPLAGDGFVDELRFDPMQVLNAGIEDLSFRQTIDRVIEVHEAAPLACAVIAPPAQGLRPEAGDSVGTSPTFEAAWEADVARLPDGLLTVFLRAGPEEGDPLSERFYAWLAPYCAARGLQLLEWAPARPKTGLLDRLLGGRKSQPAPETLAQFLQARLAEPLSTVKAPAASGQRAAAPAGAHGPEDVGRNYPLW